MLKLYKRIKSVLHYHEAWVQGAKITEHWGKVGDRGETAEYKRNRKLSEEKNLQQVLSTPLSEGYEPLDDDQLVWLLIEYTVEGMGNTDDLEKRSALEGRMNETLGWTGLGHCDGGSIGSGTMEVCCIVVDFEIAQQVIKKDLSGTEFEDYVRIFNEQGTEAETNVAFGGMPSPQAPPMLVPPWLMCPGIDRQGNEWAEGKPSEYLAEWISWYLGLPVQGRVAYSSVFQEPNGWLGFYESVRVGK